MPTLTSGRYHIKWTQLADLPAPLNSAYAAVHDKKVYIAGGESPVEDAVYQVYVYDINTDQWGQLPPVGHKFGIPHFIGGKLVIIGGRLSTTKKKTNKVSTFDEDSQTWTSYYPDLLSVRSKPGVVSHLEHVIVAGGARHMDEYDGSQIGQDDIEVLNWIENSHWRKVSIKLPVPMYAFTPTIVDDCLLIGSHCPFFKAFNHFYKMSVANITAPIYQNDNIADDALTEWTELTIPTHWFTDLVPNASPPVIVGGENEAGTILTADIKMYDNSDKSWKKIGSLSFARSRVAIAAVYDNAVIVIGGCTRGDTMASRKSSSLTVVELGQLL